MTQRPLFQRLLPRTVPLRLQLRVPPNPKGRVARIEEVHDLTVFGDWDAADASQVCMIQHTDLADVAAQVCFSMCDSTEPSLAVWDIVFAYELLSLPGDALLRACAHANPVKSIADPIRFDANSSQVPCRSNQV